MKYAARFALAAVLLLALVAVPASASVPAPATLPACDTVVVVLAPYLTWSDIESGTAPAIAALAGYGAVASASIQSGSLDVSPPSARGAAIVSAGEPVEAPEAGSAGPIAPVGGLGEAVLDSGGFTAAIGTSATGAGAAPSLAETPALVLAGDSSGSVSFLANSADLLSEDAGAPFGVAADVDALSAAYLEALVPGSGRRLVVIDPGELDRARAAATTVAEWEAMRLAAVRTTDEAVAMAFAGLPDDAVLLIVSTAQYDPDGTPGLGPVILYGADSGVLVSAGTRTEGLVTLPDVTATIAGLLGIDAPEGTIGSALSIAGDGRDAPGRIAALGRADDVARSLEAVRLPAWIIQGGGGLVIMLAGVIAVLVLSARRASGRRTPGCQTPGCQTPGTRTRRSLAAGRLIACALIAVMALPIGLLLIRAIAAPMSVPGAWLRLAGWCVAVAAATLVVGRWRGPAVAIGVIGWANALLIAADQLLGAPLAAGSPLSYSVIFGTRFYGLGNEGAGVMIGAVLIAVAWLFDRGACPPGAFLIAGVPIVLVAVLPSLGANVGVAAWGVVGVVGAYLYAARRRLTWRVVLAALAAVLALLAAAVAVDVLSPSTSHFGQLLESATGDGGSLTGILTRKIALGMETLFATPAMIALPVGILLALRLLARPSGPFGEFVSANRGSAAALCGAVAAALTALVTEDSGAVVAALVMFLPTAALIALTLVREVAWDPARQARPRADAAGTTEDS